MTESFARLFSWPAQLTRDYFAGLLVGLGFGCIAGHLWFSDQSSNSALIIGLAVAIVGAALQIKKAGHATEE